MKTTYSVVWETRGGMTGFVRVKECKTMNAAKECAKEWKNKTNEVRDFYILNNATRSIIKA